MILFGSTPNQVSPGNERVGGSNQAESERANLCRCSVDLAKKRVRSTRPLVSERLFSRQGRVRGGKKGPGGIWRRNRKGDGRAHLMRSRPPSPCLPSAFPRTRRHPDRRFLNLFSHHSSPVSSSAHQSSFRRNSPSASPTASRSSTSCQRTSARCRASSR